VATLGSTTHRNGIGQAAGGDFEAMVDAGLFRALVIFTVPLTALTSTAEALGAGPGEQAWMGRSAMGSGASNTARYPGSATGLTVCAIIVTPAGSARGAVGMFAGWNRAVLVTVAFSLLGAFAVFFARPRIVDDAARPDEQGDIHAYAVHASKRGQTRRAAHARRL
jgi:hypothetical protein